MRKFFIFTLCFCTLFLCFVIPSFADEGITSRAVPTDLTGYTVSVSAGWSCNEGYGVFDISGTIFGFDFTSVGIGFNEGVYEMADYIEFRANNNYRSFNPSDSLEFTISGGNHVNNSSLISWLNDNNATFTPSTPSTFTIDAGYWTPTGSPTTSNDDVLAIGVGNTLIYEMPALNGWVNAEGFTTYIDNVRFTLVSTNRTGSAYHLEVGYHDGYEYVRLYTIHKASSGTFTLTVDNQFRYFYFNDSFEVDAVGNALINGFFTYGTTEPDVDPPVPDIENFLTMFLNGVVSALDVDIFGYFSILDLIKVLVGACFIVWLLKMLAGG